MLKTFRALKTLTSEQRAAVDAKLVSGTFTMPAFIDDLRAVAEFDAHNDASRRFLKKALGVSALGLFFSIFVGIESIADGNPLGACYMCAFGPATLYLFLTLRKLKRLDVSDNVRQVALPFLVLLKQDIAPNQPFEIYLDLKSPTDSAKSVQTSDPYERGRYHEVTDTTYRDPWFQGSVTLADGASIRWRILDDVIESVRTRRASRGRTKTKTRYRKRSNIDLAVSLPAKRYHVDGSLPQLPADHKVSIEHGEKRATIKLSQKLKTKSLDAIAPNVLIDAVSMAYRCARPLSHSSG